MAFCRICNEDMGKQFGAFAHDFERNGVSYTVKAVYHGGLYHIVIVNNATEAELVAFNTEDLYAADNYMRKIVDGYSGEELP
jgi:hypothetical protein